MDWDFAIERRREDLLGLIVGLFAMIGLAEGVAIERLPRVLYRIVLRALQPAESAVRRLIVVMARDIVVKPRPKRPFPKGRVIAKAKSQGESQNQRASSFKLFEPQKDFESKKRRRHRQTGRKVEPRVTVIDTDLSPRERFLRRFMSQARAPAPPRTPPSPSPPAPPPQKDNTVNAARLCRRLFAILHALEDLPRQARRLARWGAKPVGERRPPRASPLRYGWPPGWRIKSTHEVDEILKECHWLVRQLPVPDTS